ncbi:hypothetical protein MYSTI_05861 [Myxococcus stipitatus DSM 14675]|uniref:DUF7481 domain-containing protein n=1 Tax=Myxococcus stipitatus (strain DSM 14675 / JCM 12634 / Mx s8) TaxID=1278073 RepID=L7UHU4_MYXSD|nr:hypothetical protein [Myxococcus stipitatus]AGC47137.1 hypothetical protein MYSTI_05861 [Myxococcus stipitatus DSM 14675]
MGRIYAGLVLAALWGAGCGRTEEPTAAEPIERHLDGSRIKAKAVSTEDGLRWFQQLYDSQRQEPCLWQKAAPDGAYYCVGITASPLGVIRRTSQENNYADDRCTLPLLYFSQAPRPDALIPMGGGTCDEPQRFHSLGKVWGQSYYHLEPNGDCLPDVRHANELYPVGPLVEPGDYFVRGTLREKQHGGGIKAYVIAGEDGSESFQSLHDTTHATECAVRLARDGKFRCLPVDEPMGVSDFVSVEPTCTERALTTLFRVACTPPRFALLSDNPEACHPEVSVIAVGKEVRAPFAYGGTSSTCTQFTPGPGFTSYYRAGSELPARSWPEAKELDLEVHGRLTVRGMEVAGAVKIPTELFDTGLGVRCTFERVPAGTLRCIPSTDSPLFQPRYFADAACTTPVTPRYRIACTADRYATFHDASGPTPGVRVYNLGPRHEGTVYLSPSAGPPYTSCMEIERKPQDAFYLLGAEVDPTSLVQGIETMN